MHKFLFHPIHDLAQIQWVSEAAWFLSYPVTYGIIVLVLIWAIFWSRRKMYTFSLIFLTGISAWFVAHFVKVLLRVPRPFVEMHFTPVQFESGFSFPSEHAAVLTALGFAVAFVHKKFGSFILSLALIVGISRVVLGVHYPVDVLGGIALGYLVYLPYKKLFSRF